MIRVVEQSDEDYGKMYDYLTENIGCKNMTRKEFIEQSKACEAYSKECKKVEDYLKMIENMQ